MKQVNKPVIKQEFLRTASRRGLAFGLVVALLAFDGMEQMAVSLLRGFDADFGVQAANKDHTSLRLLKQVVPGADSFSDKEGEPPVYRAYRTESSGESTLIGYAFVTPDVPPEPVGYNGPIDTLVGIDLQGNITGVEVVYYKESLRYTIGDFFSWGFAEQFVGKTAADRFQVDRDLDGIARATISAKAMARGVRQALRAVKQAYVD
jgi:transcriptional regulator of nitric oxide reductase